MLSRLLIKFINRRTARFNYKLNNSRIRQSFLFTVILDSLNINVRQQEENAAHNVNFAFGIFILAIICLFNFINVVGYLIALYLVNKYDVETKYPKFKKLSGIMK